jgi:sortase B
MKKFALILIVLTVLISGCNNGYKVPLEDEENQETTETASPVTEPETQEPEPEPELPAQRLENYLSWFEQDDWFVRNNFSVDNVPTDDLVGYLKIPGTPVDYPVLQGADNDHYMDRDIFGNLDYDGFRIGAIVADFRNIFDGGVISDNTVLYGHNSLTGRITFSSLVHYYRSSNGLNYYRQNPVVHFNTLYEEMQWKVFAVVMYNTQSWFGEKIRFWEFTEFADEDEFHHHILTIMDRSVLFTDVDIQYGDRLLSLMTCYYPWSGADSRIVVYARQVREGESSEVDVDKAVRNTHVRQFAGQTRHFGTSGWNGERVWDTSYLTSYNGEQPLDSTTGKGRKLEIM